MLNRIIDFNNKYAFCLDNTDARDWPDFFTQSCLYKITNRRNIRMGYLAGIIYADSKAMLSDRISALHKANVYEEQCYRHIISVPLIFSDESDKINIKCSTNFIVARTVKDAETMLFCSGQYQDVFSKENDGLLLKERIVVCDSLDIDTLLAIPL